LRFAARRGRDARIPAAESEAHEDFIKVLVESAD
jgi:hypothetical protein